MATQRFRLQWEGQGTKGMAGEQVVGAETQPSHTCQCRASLSSSSQGVTGWLKWAGGCVGPIPLGYGGWPRDPNDPLEPR